MKVHTCSCNQLVYLHMCHRYYMAVPRSDQWHARSWRQCNQRGIGICTIVNRPHRYPHSYMDPQRSHCYRSGNSHHCILDDTCKSRNPNHWCIHRYFGKGLRYIRLFSDRRTFHCTPGGTDNRMFLLYQCIFPHWHKVCVVCKDWKEVRTDCPCIQQYTSIWTHSPAKSNPEVTFTYL